VPCIGLTVVTRATLRRGAAPSARRVRRVRSCSRDVIVVVVVVVVADEWWTKRRILNDEFSRPRRDEREKSESSSFVER
jgi:hypothetical protein